MRPTSPLSLLFVRLISASPILILLPDYKTSACTAFISNPKTAPIRPTEPHFPPHQVSSATTNSEVRFDNTPITPSAKVPAHVALAAAVPLSSAFLKSLANPASSTPVHDPVLQEAAATEDLPAKPTSALPELREEDARLYWASRGGSAIEDEVAAPAAAAPSSAGPELQLTLCGHAEYLRTTNSRDYADLIVVGIVVLFLAVVVVIEALEKHDGVQNFFRGRGAGRGEIYLEHEDMYIIKKPLSIQASPLPQSKTSSDVVQQPYGQDHICEKST